MHDNQRQTQWSYIAGVMDSDGCFMITRHKKKTQRKDYPHRVENWSWTYTACVKITQIQPEAVTFIKEEMGHGTISIVGARLSRPNSMPLYEWSIKDIKKVRSFLEEVIPYLRIKKNRAKFLLDYCKQATYLERGKRTHGLSKDELIYREESYQKMRELNGKKVAATTKSHGHESVSDSLIL